MACLSGEMTRLPRIICGHGSAFGPFSAGGASRVVGPAPGRPLVAAPDACAPRPLCDAGAVGVGAAVPGGHRVGVLDLAQRGIRARGRVGQARCGDRAATDPSAPDREPRAAGPTGPPDRDARDRCRRGTAAGAQVRHRAAGGDADHLARCVAPQACQLCLSVGRCRHAPARPQRGPSARPAGARPRGRVGVHRCARPAPAGVLAAIPRRDGRSGVSDRRAAAQRRRVRRRLDRRVLDRGPAALLRAAGGQAPARNLGARRKLATCSSAR